MTIDEEILKTWRKYVGKKHQKASRLDVKKSIAKAERHAKKDAAELLGLWLALLDEALHLLLILHKFTRESRESAKEKSSPAFIMLLSRACMLVVAIRKLVISGLEGAARPIGRSLMETIDLAIATLADDELGNIYFPDTIPVNHNEFWKKNVAWGKIDKRILDILNQLTLSEEQKQRIEIARNWGKEYLSEDVHSSSTSAFRAWFVPSLRHPGKLSGSLVGHVSLHSPQLLSWVIYVVYYFIAIVIRLLISDKLPLAFQGEVSDETMDSLFVAALSYQELVFKHSQDLPPPLTVPTEDDDESSDSK